MGFLGKTKMIAYTKLTVVMCYQIFDRKFVAPSSDFEVGSLDLGVWEIWSLAINLGGVSRTAPATPGLLKRHHHKDLHAQNYI